MELPGATNRGRAVFDTMLSSAVLMVQEQYQGNQRQFAVQLDQHPLKLGRTTQGGLHGPNDLVLEVPFAARDQARIEPEGLGHRLVHLGAPNRLNGQRISQHPLNAGDIIQIGPFKLVYQRTRLDQYDQRRGMRIDVRDLTHTVTAGGQQKRILDSVSLSFEAREFVAIVGGSGAGKSTLMRAISGYVRASGGQVLVNGDDFYQHFDAYRALMGYVPQDDILHQTLQVDRALDYAARLRLSADSDASEIRQRVEQALGDVDMLPHRAKNVENLSGGQRKRVSIAAELLADPSLFFLDEPTSGLDPGLEKKMMHTLRQLADGGRTVVLVTHATENIALCDHVVFMASGRMVFFGPPADALSFFGVTSGLFSEIYTRLEGRADEGDPLVQANLAQEYATWRQQHPQQADMPTLAELWELKYRSSAIHQRYVASRLAAHARQSRAAGAATTSSAPVAAAPVRAADPALRRADHSRPLEPADPAAPGADHRVDEPAADRQRCRDRSDRRRCHTAAASPKPAVRPCVDRHLVWRDQRRARDHQRAGDLPPRAALEPGAAAIYWLEGRGVERSGADSKRGAAGRAGAEDRFRRAAGRAVRAVAGAVPQPGAGVTGRHGAGIDHQRTVLDQRPGDQHGAAGIGASDRVHWADFSA